jgi:putative Holliday junction resolvase
MLRGRRMAFDYGDVRIGVAVCDPDGILATPVVTLKNTNRSIFILGPQNTCRAQQVHQ